MDFPPSANNHQVFLARIKDPATVPDFDVTPSTRSSLLYGHEKRPPPEPPPLGKGKTLKVPFVAPPPSDPVSIRPPPKPPDVGIFSVFVSVVAGVDAGSLLYEVFFWVVCFKNALQVFDEMPRKSLAFWNNIRCEDINVAGTNLSILSTYHLASKQVVYLDKLETTYSRNELSEVKEMIRN